MKYRPHLFAIAAVFALTPAAVLSASAQDKPQNEITKLEKAREKDRTVMQVTVDPKKSPGKHADNLSKNVNHEADRNSKHVNNGIRKASDEVHNARKTDHTTRQVTVDPHKSPGKHVDSFTRNVNHDLNRNSKHVNNGIRKESDRLHRDRKQDHTTRQVTVDPHKSPGKHVDSFTRNVNHDANRNSKNLNNGIKQGTNDLHQARKEDHTVRQVTVDPKKSPGKHVDNLSKNVNHEANRISKDVNHLFGGHKKKDADKKD